MKMNLKKLESLFTTLKHGDLTAFDEFYEETKRIIYFNIYNFVKNSYDTEDLLQDTYVAFLNNLGNIKDVKLVIGYLLQTSKNLSLNYLKTMQKSRVLEDFEENNISNTDHYDVDNSELIRKISSILKDTEFQIFYLKVVEEYSHQEIATMLNRPLGTVTWAYNNAIKKLQKGLKGYGV